MKVLFFSFLFLISNSHQSDTNSQLFPPGSLGTNEFNVTGPLNSFVEQIQANSRSTQEIPVQVPVVQMPTAPPGHGSINYYGNGANQAQPVLIGPQNRPALDPALQQLLNSFNTNPMEQQRNTFIQHSNPHPSELNTPVVSYVTCYVGCSHVTNIITSSAQTLTSFNFFTLIALAASVYFALLL